jgi:putative flippase GtrA
VDLPAVVRQLIQWLQALRFARYLGASVVALAADVGLFLMFLAAGLFAPAASAASYCVGIAVHWLISSRFVFSATAAPAGAERWRQKLLFLMSAVVGLTLTVAIVSGAEVAGIDPRIAKMIAIVVSFTTTYFLRRTVVFAAR